MTRGDCNLLLKFVAREKVEKHLPKGWDSLKVVKGVRVEVVQSAASTRDLANGFQRDPQELPLEAEKKRRAARATHELGSFSPEPVQGRRCVLIDPDADELAGPGGASVLKKFVRRKKVDKDLTNGFDPQEITLNAEKEQREGTAIHKLRSSSHELLQGGGCELIDPDADVLKAALTLLIDMRGAEEGDLILGIDSEVHVESQLGQKPKYFNKVKTGYKRNKYTGTQYDYDSPGPKPVRGYEFNIFYPGLLETGEDPTVSIYRAESSEATRVIRFHAGPPYADIAFRIVNRELEFSRRPGVRCTFNEGLLQVYFNLKRHGIGCLCTRVAA